MGIMETLTALMAVLSHFPWSIDQIIAFGIGIKMLYDAFVNKQWDKARQIAYDTALTLVAEVMDHKEKRDAVIAAVWAYMPRPLRAIATAEQVEAMVEEVYQLRVAPDALHQGIVKGGGSTEGQ